MQDQQGGDGTAAMEDGPAPAVIRHLGVLVVYHLKDDDDLPLLRLHLERIHRHTRVPYTLFAVANRVSPAARALIQAQPNVVLCDITPTDARGSREHGYYLDAMVPIALASGVSHVCTLDVDSFPINDGWLDVLVAKAPRSGVAAVSRAENGDPCLPHPSCLLAPRGLFEEHAISFSPDPDDTREYRRFARATGQAPDTGVRLAVALWASNEEWGRLLRSNTSNPHYLMAGIYDGVVFHLGGLGRGKVFRADLHKSRLPGRLASFAPFPARSGRRRRGEEQEAGERNRAIYAELRARLIDDPDGLFAYLLGHDEPHTASADAADAAGAPERDHLDASTTTNGDQPGDAATNGAGSPASMCEPADRSAPADLFPLPVVTAAPPRELRYRRALEIGTALRALWDSRRIVWALIVRQVRAQYSQQVLGLAWAIFTPFAQTIVFTVLLNRVGTRSTVNTEGVPKMLFLYAGLTAWSFVSTAIGSGGVSLVGNPLLNKVYAPREVFPIAQVATSLLNTVAALVVFPVLLLVAGRGVARTFYWSIVLGVVLIVFATAITLFVAATTVYMRDLRSGLPLVLQLGMFFPGVLYPLRLVVPAGGRGVYALLFPPGTLIDQMRETLFQGTAPAPGATLLATLGTALYLAGGFVYFKRLETGFADVS